MTCPLLWVTLMKLALLLVLVLVRMRGAVRTMWSCARFCGGVARRHWLSNRVPMVVVAMALMLPTYQLMQAQAAAMPAPHPRR